MQYENILVEIHGKVGLITLNRPAALNALNDKLMDELGLALQSFDADDDIGCMRSPAEAPSTTNTVIQRPSTSLRVRNAQRPRP